MKVKVYTDGGARGNPGPAAYGFLIYKNNEKIFEECKYIGETTNNVAEYQGVLSAIEYIANNLKSNDICIYLDSLLVQKQLSGEYKVKNMILKNFVEKIKFHENKIKSVDYIHIKREKNKEADYLVNKALDSVT